MTVASYKISLEAADGAIARTSVPGVAVLFLRLMRETEENLQSLMPPGLTIKIEED